MNPLAFPATDEAVVRMASGLMARQGNVILKLPFSDPEDLAHMRAWLSMDDTALPTYAPVSIYGYGLLLCLGSVGLWLIACLPAAAIAAFAAGTARLLPSGRRWLALLAPMLGFVSFYWLLRPWMNLSCMLICLCWAYFFWTSWHRERRVAWLFACALAVGAAAAIRPDYAAFLLISLLLLLLSNDPERWKLIAGLGLLAGVCALLPNLILNKAITGHALRAVYQIALDRQYGESEGNGLDHAQGLSALSALKVLLLPMGMPSLTVATTEFKKYFVGLFPVPFLVLTQLTLVPLVVRQKSWLPRALLVAQVLFAAFFVVTRLHADLFGGAERVAALHHSVPRYLAPLFLFAALPPLLFLGHCRSKAALIVGSALAVALALSCGRELYRQPSSFGWIRQWVHKSEALLGLLEREIPANAIVYSPMDDKVLWSRWAVGTIEDAARSSASIERALGANIPAFVLMPRNARNFRQLSAALAAKQLTLVRVDARAGLYRVRRQ